MKILMFLILIGVSSCAITAQNGNPSISSNQTEITQKPEIIDVNLCDLDQHPEKFEQKLIKIKAIYLYGFEWSTLDSTKCEIKKRIWVERNKTKCNESDKVDEMDFAGMGGRTVGIIAVGQFTGGENERYGNMNRYNYLFKINCFEKAVMLDRKNLLPDNLELKKKMAEFENSN